jgi:hypothetical protein
MHRVLTVSLLLPLTIFPLWGLPENIASKSTQLTVAVYNDADVPPEVLHRAEERAASIFARADFDLVWVHCLRANPEDALTCKQTDLPGHLALRIVPDAARSTTDTVFGVAFLSRDGTGKYCDVFWKRAKDLSAVSNLDLGSILGSVMAHEMGHLLLGSKAHAVSGIMRGRWEGEERRRIAMGTLLFTPQQAKRMRRNTGRVETAEQPVQPPNSEWTKTAISAAVKYP